MFGKLEKSDIQQIGAYLESNFEETLYFQKVYEELKQDILQGTFYGYIQQGDLVGLFYFSNKNSLTVHYSDSVVLGNLNLLKAIKHHKPKYIKGEVSVIEGIYRVICRTLDSLHEDDSILMRYDSNRKIENVEIPFEWISAASGDVFQELKFFINVETQFGRNVKSINDISKDLREMLKQKKYYLVRSSQGLIGQGLIEEETSTLGIIGGIYVDPLYRQKGIGEAISLKLTRQLLEKEKKPYLFVMTNNKHAIHLYEKIGYKVSTPYRILTVRYQ
ncbi:GNAT family N-acetyltransferase [Fusibacter ferrireducens]|uniref:GNAT family N-acetyltransferase n=1 Tax=Fusibacter ferrireducens TaxID=2785058 RepID=A0ABR9ZZR4_9FIRM|nr:GNAT family N-acetyltransferase [Fusibacter ferrireducens]MBF4695673.1 GNAT family N-acetyltransferase [Fusibacter ferrireducens]